MEMQTRLPNFNANEDNVTKFSAILLLVMWDRMISHEVLWMYSSSKIK